jgi:pimeloyl-ACP methyl ester carboxylesterase
MKETIAQLTTKDKIILPGILYRPKPSTKKVLVYLHGTGGHDVFTRKGFYDDFAKHLAKKNIGLLAFNNRGAHLVDNKKIQLKTKSRRITCGASFELIEDAVLDIKAAADFLKKEGFSTLFLMGHSSGANKVCVWDDKTSSRSNMFSKYILFGGGDDTGILYDNLGEKMFLKTLRTALHKVEDGEGEETIMLGGYLPVMSYQSFLDMANPDGHYNVFPFYEVLNNVELSEEKEWFSEYRNISKPTLVVYGDKDEYLYGRFKEIEDMMVRFSNDNHSFLTISGGDHGCSGHRSVLFKAVANWLAE